MATSGFPVTPSYPESSLNKPQNYQNALNQLNSLNSSQQGFQIQPSRDSRLCQKHPSPNLFQKHPSLAKPVKKNRDKFLSNDSAKSACSVPCSLEGSRASSRCASESGVFSSETLETAAKPKPLILHVDVNKSIILSDTVVGRNTEETIHEVAAGILYGTVCRDPPPSIELPGSPEPSSRSGSKEKQENGGNEIPPGQANGEADPVENPHPMVWWQWDGVEPPLGFSVDKLRPPEEKNRITYLQFVRQHLKEKKARQEALRNLFLVWDPAGRAMLGGLAQKLKKRMLIPDEMCKTYIKDLEECGLKTEYVFIFPSFFHLVVQLQKQNREFAIYFRSFGTDLGRVRQEWNAFCEGKHPLYVHLLKDIGTMDGNTPGVPDRRLHPSNMHTMYRDADGPVLGLRVQVDGPEPGAWDKWGRLKDPPTDTRNGRDLLKDRGAECIIGYPEIRKWWREETSEMKTSAVKEDWAWWHHNKEVASAGKPMIAVEGVIQVFLDDSIALPGSADAKIVDARDYYLMPIPFSQSQGALLFRVCALAAILNTDYFIKAVETLELRQQSLSLEHIPTCRRRSVGASLYGVGGVMQIGSWMDDAASRTSRTVSKASSTPDHELTLDYPTKRPSKMHQAMSKFACAIDQKVVNIGQRMGLARFGWFRRRFTTEGQI